MGMWLGMKNGNRIVGMEYGNVTISGNGIKNGNMTISNMKWSMRMGIE